LCLSARLIVFFVVFVFFALSHAFKNVSTQAWREKQKSA